MCVVCMHVCCVHVSDVHLFFFSAEISDRLLEESQDIDMEPSAHLNGKELPAVPQNSVQTHPRYLDLDLGFGCWFTLAAPGRKLLYC